MVQLKAMWSAEMKSLFKGVDPQAVAEEILSIGDEPTNHEIVEKARDEQSSMHCLFEWNNDVAAEKYREVQAGHIMRHLKITYVGINDGDAPQEVVMQPTRLFYGNPTQQSGYVSLPKIMGDADVYQALLERAKNELASFRQKYKILKELQPIFEMIDDMK